MGRWVFRIPLRKRYASPIPHLGVLSFLICEVGALLGKKNKSRELEAFPGLYIKRWRFRDGWRHLAAPRAPRYRNPKQYSGSLFTVIKHILS